jgi:hypothetical protein
VALVDSLGFTLMPNATEYLQAGGPWRERIGYEAQAVYDAVYEISLLGRPPATRNQEDRARCRRAASRLPFEA